MTDRVRAKMKGRRAIFREEGRSIRWKHLDEAIKKTLDRRRAKHNEDQKVKLETAGKTTQWFSIAKFLGSDEAPSGWKIPNLNLA